MINRFSERQGKRQRGEPLNDFVTEGLLVGSRQIFARDTHLGEIVGRIKESAISECNQNVLPIPTITIRSLCHKPIGKIFAVKQFCVVRRPANIFKRSHYLNRRLLRYNSHLMFASMAMIGGSFAGP